MTKTRMVLKQPPPSFFAPQPAATPRNNLLMLRTKAVVVPIRCCLNAAQSDRSTRPIRLREAYCLATIQAVNTAATAAANLFTSVGAGGVAGEHAWARSVREHRAVGHYEGGRARQSTNLR
jgi:alkylation response protein AidB-like acyl-CoA dehydrogenase